MKTTKILTALGLLTAGAALMAAVLPQDTGAKKAAVKYQEADGFQNASAKLLTPFHKELKNFAGTWDATVAMQGAEPSRGVETNTLVCNGLWLLTQFKGEFMGSRFQGHGIMGYDPQKKKYVSVWVDSMSSSLTVGEGTIDPETKTLTTVMDGPGPDGGIVQQKTVETWKDKNHRTVVFSMPIADSKDVTSMTIEYERRK
ncbi:MAG: DUF1579 domain-containing protein [Planctomycetota bacterium]